MKASSRTLLCHPTRIPLWLTEFEVPMNLLRVQIHLNHVVQKVDRALCTNLLQQKRI